MGLSLFCRWTKRQIFVELRSVTSEYLAIAQMRSGSSSKGPLSSGVNEAGELCVLLAAAVAAAAAC